MENEERENCLVFSILKRCVGLIKGLRGGRLRNIEQKFFVGIWINEDTGPDEVLVYVYGSKDKCEMARQYMVDIVATEYAVIKLPLPVAGMLVAADAKRLKEIERKFDVRIHVDKVVFGSGKKTTRTTRIEANANLNGYSNAANVAGTVAEMLALQASAPTSAAAPAAKCAAIVKKEIDSGRFNKYLNCLKNRFLNLIQI